MSFENPIENPIILHSYEVDGCTYPPVYEECSNCTYSVCRLVPDEEELPIDRQSEIDAINDEIEKCYGDTMLKNEDDIINDEITEYCRQLDEDEEEEFNLSDEDMVEVIGDGFRVQYLCQNSNKLVYSDDWCRDHWLNRSNLSDEATDEMDRLEAQGHVFKQAAEMHQSQIDKFIEQKL